MRTGEKIREKMKAANMRQFQMAERLEIDPSEVSRMLAGIKAVPFRILERAAEIFDCTINELIGDDGFAGSKAVDTDERVAALNQAIVQKNARIRELEDQVLDLMEQVDTLTKEVEKDNSLRQENEKLKKYLFEKWLSEVMK